MCIAIPRYLAACALAASTLLTAGPVGAQWYHVEVVAFRYVNPIAADDEQWVGAVWEPEIDGITVDLIEALPEIDEAAILDDEPADTGPALPTAFLSLPAPDHRIEAVAQRLARAPGYDVLLHVAWRQPSYGSYRARGVRLRNWSLPAPLQDSESEAATMPAPAGEGESTPAAPLDNAAEDFEADEELLMLQPSHALDGILRLKVGSQLNIDADFVYRGEDDIPLRLEQERRVRLRELHYFDHPRFGLLVQVTPFVPGSDEPAE